MKKHYVIFKKISFSTKIDGELSIFIRMREWEKRLTIKKGIYRIAGRIVEEHNESQYQKKIDFCPCYIRRYLERKKKEEEKKRRMKS
jgi:hypothetical protein